MLIKQPLNKVALSLLRIDLAPVAPKTTRLAQQVRHLTKEQEDKQFVDRPSPYTKPKRICILCKHNIKLDYKNPRLLSQFVSPLNGDIYDKHITGLCEAQQRILELQIKQSRSSLLMPIYYKHPKYNKDPPLFNPDRPQRPNPY